MNRFFKVSIYVIAFCMTVVTVSAQVTTSWDDAYQAAVEANPTGAVEIITSERIGKYSFSSTEAMVGQFAALNGLQIRGYRSTNASAAMTLIDGFEQGFENVEIEDIETIQILKDAAATARYGVRGANGVILITTKRGYESDKISVTAKVQSGVLYTGELPDFVSGSVYDSVLEDITGASFSGSRADINWADEMLKSVVGQFKALAQVSGGTERAKYYMSAMYQSRGSEYNYDNSDVAKYSRSDQVNLRSNLDVKINRNTDWTVLFSANIGNENTPEVTDLVDLFYSTPASRYHKYANFTNDDGSVSQYFYGTSQFSENPLGEFLGKGYTNTKSRLITAQTALVHRMDYLTKGLSVKATAAFKADAYGVENYSATYLTTDGTAVYGEYTPLAAKTRSSGNDSWEENRWSSYSVGLGYDRDFGGKHDLSLSLTSQMDSYTWSYDTFDTKYFNLIGAAKYSYENRYVAHFTTTYGGGNSLSPSSRFIALPTLGLAWNVSNESFWGGSDVINSLKVRGSIGMLGSDELGSASRFMYLSSFISGSNYTLGTSNKSTATIYESAYEYDGTYERSRSANIGIDARLFNSLNISLDYFNETRYDIYESYSTDISDTWGGTTPVFNHGKVHSQGLEFVANYSKSVNQDLKLNAGLVVGYSRNIIKDTYEYENPYYSQIGNGVNQKYGFIADGLYQESDFDSSGSVIGAVSSYGSVQAGDIKYKDISGANGTPDGIIDNYDKVGLLSNSNPLNIGLNFDLSYKRFTLGAMFDSQLNSQTNVMNNIIYSPLDNGYDNISTFAYENSYSSSNTNATLPRLSTTESSNNSQNTTLYIVKTNYLRLRTLQLGYTFAINSVAGLSDKQIGVNLCAHNLFTLDSLPSNMNATNLDYAINGSAFTVSVDFTF